MRRDGSTCTQCPKPWKNPWENPWKRTAGLCPVQRSSRMPLLPRYTLCFPNSPNTPMLMTSRMNLQLAKREHTQELWSGSLTSEAKVASFALHNDNANTPEIVRAMFHSTFACHLPPPASHSLKGSAQLVTNDSPNGHGIHTRRCPGPRASLPPFSFPSSTCV